MAYKGRVHKGGYIRDEKGHFATVKDLTQREIDIIMERIEPSMGEVFTDFAYTFFNGHLPQMSGNLIDSMSVGVFRGGTALFLTDMPPRATKKQYWGGRWKSKGFGVNFRVISPMSYFEGDHDLENNKSYSIIFSCGIPYGRYLEDGYAPGHIKPHPYWFSNLVKDAKDDLENKIAVRLKAMGITVTLYRDVDWEMVSGLVTTDIF